MRTNGQGVTMVSPYVAGVVVALLHLAASIASGGPACAVVEGSNIGAIRLGMTVQAVLGIAGPAGGQQSAGNETAYSLREPWSYMVAEYGIVRRIATQSAGCQTARGIGPGAAANAVRSAYSGASVSVATPLSDGEVLSYPFQGIRFVVRRGRVEIIEVFRAEALGAPGSAPASSPPGAPASSSTPAATGGPASPAAATWVIRSASTQVQGNVLVVSGTVDNRGPAASPYAEVRAFGMAGRLVGRGDAPLTPTPVPAGGVATFEVRLPFDDVVRRFTVILRPARTLVASLAEQSFEVKDLQQFAEIVARKLQVSVEVTTHPPTQDDFIAVATNGGPLLVASATVSVELIVTCRLGNVPAPMFRNIQERRTASVVIPQLRPGETARVALPLSTGACPYFATWAATTRVGEVRIGE